MDYHSIKNLLEKFWLGETSLEEENTLKEYFRYNQSPPEEFRMAAEYFDSIEQEQDMVLDDQFDQEVMQRITSLKKRDSIKLWPYMVAASIALLIGLTVFNNNRGHSVNEDIYVEEFIDTYNDPKEAYDNVRAALMMVSSGINEGMSYTGELRKFDQAQQEISNK